MPDPPIKTIFGTWVSYSHKYRNHREIWENPSEFFLNYPQRMNTGGVHADTCKRNQILLIIRSSVQQSNGSEHMLAEVCRNIIQIIESCSKPKHLHQLYIGTKGRDSSFAAASRFVVIHDWCRWLGVQVLQDFDDSASCCNILRTVYFPIQCIISNSRIYTQFI